MNTKTYELSPGKHLGIDPATGDLTAKACSNCISFRDGECHSFRAVLNYIFNESLNTLPETLRVSVSADDVCSRWEGIS